MNENAESLAETASAPIQSAQIFDVDPLERVTLGYLINLLARLLAQSLRKRNGANGILPGQFPIVLELLNGKGPTQRELCDYIKVEQSTMANTLKRMERDGLIKRLPFLNDTRQFRIYLTDEGLTLANDAMLSALEVNRIALSGLDVAEQEQLRGFLLDMTLRLEADLEDSAEPAG